MQRAARTKGAWKATGTAYLTWKLIAGFCTSLPNYILIGLDIQISHGPLGHLHHQKGAITLKYVE